MVLTDPPSTVNQLIERLEGNAASLSHGRPLAEQLRSVTKVLVDLAIGMQLIYDGLIEEVLSRRGIDLRWPNARVTFARSHAIGFNVKQWPCRSERE
jgi:hypothetical protein